MFKMIYQQEKTSLLQILFFFQRDTNKRNWTILMKAEGIQPSHIVTVASLAV